MNVQAAPSPYTPVGAPSMANAPTLGAPMPGMTGGLPALSGLSATQNPVAQQLQSMGRGDDTMLVHMTPNEVNSLQGLAMSAGGSLTINPQTGLPEAGFLGKILPTLLGLGLAATGVGAPLAAGIVAAGQTALTGDLSKGLMAGLGAFGGASLAGAAGLGAAGGAAKAATGAGMDAAGNILTSGGAIPMGAAPAAGTATLAGGVGSAGSTITTGGPGFLSKFSSAAQQGLPSGILQKAAPYAAGAGLLNTVSEATAPQMPKYDPNAEDGFEYVPMRPGVREVRFQTPEQMRESGGAEFQYFTPSNPEPVPLYGQPRGFAEGGVASIPTQGFEDLVSFFNATNPGAITASMYPTPSAATPGATPSAAAPTSGGETVYDFSRRAPNATGNNFGIGDGRSPYGSFYGMPDFSNLNINAILSGMGYAPTSQPNQPGQPSQPTTPVGGTQDLFGDLGLTLGDVAEFRDTPGRGTASPPAPAPTMPAPTIPAPTMPAPTVTPDAPAPVRPAPSVPPTMMPENSPMPEMISLEDIMAMNVPAPQPTYRAPEPEPMPIRSGGGGYRDTTMPRMEAYASGGAVDMRDGSFVVDARTVSELGNGSSNAGIEMLSRMGGRPVRGPGDGVSDSVRASIGGKQEARVARDEVIFSPEAVRRLGGGSDAKGTKKLYALMDKAHKARKKAKRGQDTRVRKGLA